MISTASWSPGDVLDLAVLGLVSEQPSGPAEIIVPAIRQLVGAGFQPALDVVDGRILALAQADLLVGGAPDGCASRLSWRASQAGRARLWHLLMLRGAPAGEPLRGACVRLKVCFLDRLDAEARSAVLDDLLAVHRDALARARAALGRREPVTPFVRHCLVRDVERWEAEIGWIEALRQLATGRAAA